MLLETSLAAAAPSCAPAGALTSTPPLKLTKLPTPRPLLYAFSLLPRAPPAASTPAAEIPNCNKGDPGRLPVGESEGRPMPKGLPGRGGVAVMRDPSPQYDTEPCRCDPQPPDELSCAALLLAAARVAVTVPGRDAVPAAPAPAPAARIAATSCHSCCRSLVPLLLLLLPLLLWLAPPLLDALRPGPQPEAPCTLGVACKDVECRGAFAPTPAVLECRAPACELTTDARCPVSCLLRLAPSACFVLSCCPPGAPAVVAAGGCSMTAAAMLLLLLLRSSPPHFSLPAELWSPRPTDCSCDGVMRLLDRTDPLAEAGADPSSSPVPPA